MQPALVHGETGLDERGGLVWFWPYNIESFDCKPIERRHMGEGLDLQMGFAVSIFLL
jgi:hypothetical protein